MSKPTKLTTKQKAQLNNLGYFSKDIAQLFADLEITNLTNIQCAVAFQAISNLIYKSRGKKSVTTTVKELQATELPFWPLNRIKRILGRLRTVGVIKTKVIYFNETGGNRDGITHKTRIWINRERIVILAEQVRGEVDVVVAKS